MHPSKHRIGEIIDGRYELRAMIGRGSMADVFRAHDSRSGREVAVKILRRALTREQDALQRFYREARVQEMVKHPNVAELYGGGVTDGREPYLVFELLRGRSLRTVLQKQGRVPAERATRYCIQALQGLAAVHTLGIHHRDLKPANLMLEPSGQPGSPEDSGSFQDRVVLIDFGFASLEGAGKLTRKGHIVGSLTYMAPERLRGGACDEPAEVYSMGVILYELLVGHPPFSGDDDYALMAAHLSEEPAAPSQLAPECGATPALEALLESCLAKNPRQRPRTAADMARALTRAMAGPRGSAAEPV